VPAWPRQGKLCRPPQTVIAGHVDDRFLARIQAGERIALRFAGMRPFNAFLHWAWEHFVPFAFRREQEGIWVSCGTPEYASVRDHYEGGPGI